MHKYYIKVQNLGFCANPLQSRDESEEKGERQGKVVILKTGDGFSEKYLESGGKILT